MIRRIGMFMVIACPCVLGYYWYTNFKEPVLLIIAAFLLVFGFFSRTIIVYPETERKIKVFFFYFLAIISIIFFALNMGGEKLAKNNYWPICSAVSFLICSYMVWKYKPPSII